MDIVCWSIGALVAIVSARVMWGQKTELFVAVGMPPALVSGADSLFMQ